MRAFADVLPECDDLRRAPWKGSENPYAGHCYIVAEAMYHHGKAIGYNVRPMFIRHEGQPHWFVEAEIVPGGWQYIDPTASQFETPVPYELAKGKGFLTKQPSKRARILMERMGW